MKNQKNKNLNSELLSSKSAEDLKNIALSMGLSDHKSLTRGDYYNYIVNGKEPIIDSYTREDLEKLNITKLRNIANQNGIQKSYQLRKNEIIDKILESQEGGNLKTRNSLNNLNISKLRDMAQTIGIAKPYNLKKDELISEILKTDEIDDELDIDETIDFYSDQYEEKLEEFEIKVEELSDNATEALEVLKETNDINFVSGILDLHQDGYGFLRVNNYLPGEGDVYVSPSQIRRFKLRNGDKVLGAVRAPKANESYNGLIYIKSVNDEEANKSIYRPYFDNLTPIYPKQKLMLETSPKELSMRIIDLIAPIGKGQRGLIVSQPKSGKTTLIKKIAEAIEKNYPEIYLMVLLIDERPEEVTDVKRSVKGEVIYSTFDELPKNHTRVAENAMERAKRLVEQKKDVVILLDSLTRLARAYNLITPPSGKTLSGGLDPLSLHKPKRFFGAARNIEEGGSLTILATALVETGSKMDDIIFEEFKGTGNMEVHLDRRLSEQRIFPAIDIYKSGTRKEELLLNKEELEFTWKIRRIMNTESTKDVTEFLLENILLYENNKDFLKGVNKNLLNYEK